MRLGVSGGAGISVTVSPASLSLAPGSTQQFTAYVNGTSNASVNWTASAGTVSTSGLFTAPTTPSPLSVLVTATSVADPTKRASATVTVNSSSSALAITTSSLPDGSINVAYATSLGASGGSSPYNWTIASGALPNGITLDGIGNLAGVTKQTGTFSFTAKVTDNKGNSATQLLALLIASAGTFDGPAELPRTYLQSQMVNTPAAASTVSVSAGGDLQGALNNAICGQTISLQAGATFPGKFIFPAKGCDNQHWIVIRTSAPDTSLPAEGTRVSPCYAGVASLPGRPSFNCNSAQHVLAQILNNQTTGSGPIAFAAGANHYRLLGLEITRASGTGGLGALVSAQGPVNNIVIDRSWLHGTAHDDTQSGVALRNTTYFSIIDSYLNDFHCTAITGACTDAQTIGGGNGSNPGGPYQIVNNFLEASGENILFGGGPATTTPADIEIRRNHFFKPVLWMKGQAGFVGGVGGNPFLVKNHLELKNAQRVLVEANVFEYTWGGFSQNGFSILLTPKNQYNMKTQQNVCPTCQVTDVTIRYSTISHVGLGFQIATATSDGGGVALAGARYSIHDVILDDIDGTAYSGGGGLMQISNGWPSNVLNSLMINHITAFPQTHLMTTGNGVNRPPMWGFTLTNSIIMATPYPVWSIGGGSSDCAHYDVPILTLPACFSSYAFSNNAFIAPSTNFLPSKWPAGNYFPQSTAAVQFLNFNNAQGGDYHLLSSSPYKNAGSDGKDLGADVSAIQAAIVGVY